MPFSSTHFSTLAHDTLRVAAFTGFAPFAWREGDEVRGRDINFLRHFASLHGLDLVIDFHAFDRLWELPGQNMADIAASGISLRHPPSGQAVAWTKPYAEVRRTLLIRTEDAGDFRSMADLGHLAVVPRSAAQAHAEDTLPHSANLSFVPTLEHGIESLLLGSIDALGTGSVSAEYHIARHPGLAMVDVHADRAREYISFAARPALVEALDSFIADHAAEY